MDKRWRVVERAATDEGTLELKQRGEDTFLITIDGRVLMSSWANKSEIALAQAACEALGERTSPRVLLAGLGMGFTLRAALDILPADAEVVVAELNPVVVQWCRGPIAPLIAGAVDDPRVTVVIDDVLARIHAASKASSEAHFDAIILDLYEGPFGGDTRDGAHLWGRGALASAWSALTKDGVYAVWSEEPAKDFEKRMGAAGFSVKRMRPGKGRGRHVVYLGRKGRRS